MSDVPCALPCVASLTSLPSMTPRSSPSAVGIGLVNWPLTVVVRSVLPDAASTSKTLVVPSRESPTVLRVKVTVSFSPQPGEK